MIAGDLDLTIRKGCTFHKAFTWTDSASVAIDLTGWTINADVRRSANSGVVFDLGANITSAAAGQFAFDITDEVTQTLPEGKYKYDVIFDKDDGTRSEPVMKGTLTVEQVISQKE